MTHHKSQQGINYASWLQLPCTRSADWACTWYMHVVLLPNGMQSVLVHSCGYRVSRNSVTRTVHCTVSVAWLSLANLQHADQLLLLHRGLCTIVLHYVGTNIIFNELRGALMCCCCCCQSVKKQICGSVVLILPQECNKPQLFPVSWKSMQPHLTNKTTPTQQTRPRQKLFKNRNKAFPRLKLLKTLRNSTP